LIDFTYGGLSMSQRRIAVVITGMLVGAQVGIAAMDGSSWPTEEYAKAELARSEAEAEAVKQAATGEPMPAGEPVATGGGQRPIEAGYVVPARPRTVPDEALPALHSDVFPPSTDDRPLLPALAAYLDRKAATTELAGATPPVFPPSEEGWKLLPAQVAYFDRIEAARMAAAEVPAAPVERNESAVGSTEEKTPPAVGMMEGAQPGSGG
jgi:hypothetical protein